MTEATAQQVTPAASAVAPARADAGWIGVLVVIALGLNLRPILTTIGPLLAEIRAGTGLGLQGVSMLTVIPVLCMGGIALFIPWSTAASCAACWQLQERACGGCGPSTAPH